jgi:hypothetical protein
MISLVGYTAEHPTGTYRMYDPLTKGVHVSSDVTRLRRMFFPSPRLKPERVSVPPWTLWKCRSMNLMRMQLRWRQQKEDVDVDDGNREDGGQEEQGLEEGKEVRKENEAAQEAVENLTTTRSGSVARIPAYLREDYEASTVQIGLTRAEEHSYAATTSMEFDLFYADGEEETMVRAGIGGGFVNTNELETVKYDEAMSSKDRSQWIEAVEQEYVNMLYHGVFEPIELCKVPAGAKILSTTGMMKKKTGGRYKARITARGFEKKDGEHFDSIEKVSPVVNDITIRIILALIVMAGFWAEIVDV